jgi:hypothetical protein
LSSQTLFQIRKGIKFSLNTATLEEIVEKPTSRVPSDKNYIWTKDHVKNYMTSKTAYIWVLRVHALKEPYWAEPTLGAIRYANLKEEVSLEGLKPVLSDSKFKTIIKQLK